MSPPETLGSPPQLRWLALADLVVDAAYQRPITGKGADTLKAIAVGFDWMKFAPVVVSPVEGGRFAIVDGQHRATAAAAIGIVEVPCSIVLCDRRQQAAAFGAINGTVTQVSKRQVFKAALAAGEAAALRIQAVALAAGVRILHSNISADKMRPGDTLALKAIETIVHQHGDAVAIVALRAVVASAGDLTGVLRTGIIRAVARVIADRPGWRVDPGLMDACVLIDLEDAWRDAVTQASSRPGVLSSELLRAAIAAHLRGHLVQSSPETVGARALAHV